MAPVLRKISISLIVILSVVQAFQFHHHSCEGAVVVSLAELMACGHDNHTDCDKNACRHSHHHECEGCGVGLGSSTDASNLNIDCKAACVELPHALIPFSGACESGIADADFSWQEFYERYNKTIIDKPFNEYLSLFALRGVPSGCNLSI